MGYFIYASLVEGKPNLKIVDASSQQTCVNWHYEKDGDNVGDRYADRQEIQRLFRELLLLTCKQNLAV